jgi:hypothetical protein
MQRTLVTIALSAALLLTVGVGSSFARPVNNDNDNISAYFHKDFRQAEILETKANADYTKLTFKMNNMILTAFYTNKGELLAVTHNITSTQLPLSLLMQVKHDYSSYWISDLFELNANGETNYYLTLENTEKKVTLRSNNNNWEVYSKAAKE